MNNGEIDRVVFEFDKPHVRGGGSLLLTTDIFGNGDPGGIYLNQELTFRSHGNSATFNLYGTILTPEKLRELANSLESAITKAKTKTYE